MEPSSINIVTTKHRFRHGQYRDKGIMYVRLGRKNKEKLEKISSTEGVSASEFVRGLVEKEIWRRDLEEGELRDYHDYP